MPLDESLKLAPHRDGCLVAFSPRGLIRAARILRNLFPEGHRAGFPPLELEVFQALADPARYFDEQMELTNAERDLWELELRQLQDLELPPHLQGKWASFWERLDYDLQEVLEDGLRLVEASRASGAEIHIAT